jgi:hypothetical protein
MWPVKGTLRDAFLLVKPPSVLIVPFRVTYKTCSLSQSATFLRPRIYKVWSPKEYTHRVEMQVSKQLKDRVIISKYLTN